MVEAQVLATWLTPTSLFVLLNIILATIFLASNHSKTKHHEHHNQYHATAPPPQLVRAPSFFSRVASFNFSNQFYSESHDEPSLDPPVAVPRAPSLLYRVASFNFCRAPPPQQQENDKEEEQHEEVARDDMSQIRVRREKKPAEEDRKRQEKVEMEVKEKVVKVKKEAAPAQVRKVVKQVKEKTTAFKSEDEEVDSKADDFINKFKQQLKLQRLESLLRYRTNDATAAAT